MLHSLRAAVAKPSKSSSRRSLDLSACKKKDAQSSQAKWPSGGSSSRTIASAMRSAVLLSWGSPVCRCSCTWWEVDHSVIPHDCFIVPKGNTFDTTESSWQNSASQLLLHEGEQLLALHHHHHPGLRPLAPLPPELQGEALDAMDGLGTSRRAPGHIRRQKRPKL